MNNDKNLGELTNEMNVLRAAAQQAEDRFELSVLMLVLVTAVGSASFIALYAMLAAMHYMRHGEWIWRVFG